MNLPATIGQGFKGPVRSGRSADQLRITTRSPIWPGPRLVSLTEQVAGEPHRTGAALRMAALTLLLVLATLGLAALAAVDLPSNPPLAADSRRTGPVIAVVFMVAVLIGLVISLCRRRRVEIMRRPPAPVGSLRAIVTLALFALVFLLLDLGDRFRSAAPEVAEAPPPASDDGANGVFDVADPARATVVVLVVAGALLTWVAIAAWRSRHSPVTVIAMEPDPASASDPGDPPLMQAIDEGRAALHSAGDPRTAIVDCYLTMEVALTRAGVSRSLSDTPDEFLRNAMAGDLAGAQSAAELTALFHEARFSRHPLGEEHRDQARQALDELRSQLESA